MGAKRISSINPDIWVALSTLGVGAFVLFSIPSQVPGESLMAVYDMSSSAFFPVLAGTFMLLCGFALLMKAFAGTGAFVASGEVGEEPISYRRTLIVLALFIVYLVTIETVGMIVSSAVMIAVMALVLRYQNKKLIIISALVFPMLVFMLFELLLKILLPHGALF